MGRKTIEISKLVDFVNYKLATNCAIGEDARWGMCLMLEEFLHQTKNYRGYRYLGKEEVPQGERPGVNSDPELFKDPETRFQNTDSTRRMYFCSK